MSTFFNNLIKPNFGPISELNFFPKKFWLCHIQVFIAKCFHAKYQENPLNVPEKNASQTDERKDGFIRPFLAEPRVQ